MIVVSDTSPVRGLVALGRTALLEQLFDKVVIPVAVEQELLRIRFLQPAIISFLQQSRVEVKQMTPSAGYDILRKHLDKGESEAIVLAKQLGADLLLMDENKGRLLAKGLNLKVLGLVGVLVKAKRHSFIHEVRPLLDELIHEHGFWIQQDFYENIVRSVGEER